MMLPGTVPPIAESIALPIDGSKGRTRKSCVGHNVFRLSASVSHSEAPGMLASLRLRRSPSKEIWAFPANSSMIASKRRRLSSTNQRAPLLLMPKPYHFCTSEVRNEVAIGVLDPVLTLLLL